MQAIKCALMQNRCIMLQLKFTHVNYQSLDYKFTRVQAVECALMVTWRRTEQVHHILAQIHIAGRLPMT